jgi:hypothetical protein
MKIAVFWVVAPCSLVEVYQRFRGPCCLHHQGEFYVTFRNVFFYGGELLAPRPTPKLEVTG